MVTTLINVQTGIDISGNPIMEERLKLDPSPDGTQDELNKEFVQKQITGFNYTVNTFTQRLVDLQAIDTTKMTSEQLEEHNEKITSIERNLSKCNDKLAEYKSMQTLFTA